MYGSIECFRPVLNCFYHKLIVRNYEANEDSLVICIYALWLSL